MAKKKVTKKQVKKPTKTTVKKTIAKKSKNKKKGFTLIELLAVIIILGILMIIAIPSVTKYISDSRKSAYVDTAQNIISGARIFVNEGKVSMYDTDVTYYIDYQCINTENSAKSPYGEFVKAYVIVTYNGKGYDYYWTSVDDAGQGFKKIVRNDLLTEDKISADIKPTDILDSHGIDENNYYVIINKNCVAEEKRPVTKKINGKVGGATNANISIKWETNNPHYGDIARFEAVLYGYEDIDYTLQWLYSPNGTDWLSPEGQSWYVSGANELNLRVIYTQANGSYNWKLVVDVI